MAETYCGKSCVECAQKEQLNCQGCKHGPGRQFGGDCELAKCVMAKGHETCNTCSFMGTCAKQRRCADMPEERIRKMEAEAARKEEMAKHAPRLYKWLCVIFWLIIPNLIASVLTNQTIVQYFPACNLPGKILKSVCGIVYGVALIKLYPAAAVYKKAGICVLIASVVSSGVAILTGTPAWTLLITVPSTIVALVGEYFEFRGHAEVLDGIDGDQSNKWRKLWTWYIICYLGIFGAALILMLFPVIGLLLLLAVVIGLIVTSILKLVYLYRTAKIFRNEITVQ